MIPMRTKLKTRRVPCPRCRGAGHVAEVEPVALRAWRVASGLSQRELARRLGYSAAYLCDLENGRRRITPKIVAGYEREAR